MLLSIIITKQELLDSMVQDSLSIISLLVLKIFLDYVNKKYSVPKWIIYLILVSVVLFMFLILIKTIKYNTI